MALYCVNEKWKKYQINLKKYIDNTGKKWYSINVKNIVKKYQKMKNGTAIGIEKEGRCFQCSDMFRLNETGFSCVVLHLNREGRRFAVKNVQTARSLRGFFRDGVRGKVNSKS